MPNVMCHQVINMPLHCLKCHPRNEEFFSNVEGEEFNRLKQSIQELGVLTPLRVSKDMTIISGHQRYRAATELELEDVPVIIDDTLKDEDEKLVQLIAANFGRMKNDPVKQGRWIAEYERLRGVRNGGDRKSVGNNFRLITQEDIAAELGVDTRTLRNLKSLNTILPELQDIISEGRISATTGFKLIARLSEEEQHELLEALPEAKKFTSRQVEAYIQQIKGLEEANTALTAERDAAKEEAANWQKDAVEATKAVKHGGDSKKYMEMHDKLKKAEEELRIEHENHMALQERVKRVNKETLASNETYNKEIRRLEGELAAANARADAAGEPVEVEVEKIVEVYPDDYEELMKKARQYDAFIASREKATDFMPQLSMEDEQRNYENNLTNSVSAFASEIKYLLEDKHRVAMLTPVEKEMYIKDMHRIIDFANEMLVELKKNKEVA